MLPASKQKQPSHSRTCDGCFPFDSATNSVWHDSLHFSPTPFATRCNDVQRMPTRVKTCRTCLGVKSCQRVDFTTPCTKSDQVRSVPLLLYLDCGTAIASIGMELLQGTQNLRRILTMLRLAVLFFVIALIAALFGFGMVASMSYDAAKILFFVFIVLAVLSLLGGVLRRPPV